MKRGLLSPLALSLFALSASAVTLDQPEPAATAAANAPAPAVRDPEQQLAELSRDELVARRELTRLASESELLRARTLSRGRLYTRLASAGLLPVGGGFQAFVDHVVKLERLHRALERDLDLERQAFERRSALGQKLADLATRRGPLEAEQRTLADAQTALLAARDREWAFQQAFQGGSADGHTAVYGAVGTDPAAARAGFAGMKGRLPFPLSGRSEIHSARRKGADGPGLEMRALVGAPVRAVYPGRVAFADTYADYGRSVILDHGGGYYTVSAGLRDIDVAVGDDLKGGERMGTVGSGPAGAALYFEVRVGQETADPAEWFGI